MSDLRIGDRVYHSDHGLGIVGWIGTEQIGVEFDRIGKALLRRDAQSLRLVGTEEEEALAVLERDRGSCTTDKPPEPFFVLEQGTGKHFMGSHWGPFFGEAEEVVKRLPEIFKIARLHGGYSEFHPPSTRTDITGPKGAVLLASSEALAQVFGFRRKSHPWDAMTPWRSPGGALAETRERALEWSERDTGIACVLKRPEQADRPLEFVAMFPYCLHGIEHGLTLERVEVWESGVEAQIEADLGGVGIEFYDIDFANNRNWYQRGRHYQFVLTGLAYQAAIAESRQFTIKRTPEYFEGMRWLSSGREVPGTDKLEETFITKGMAMFLPIDKWDRDDYAFQGPIKEVWGMSMLGQRAWRLRVTVMRLDGPDSKNQDVDLDVVVTERAWRSDAPPQVGQDVEGQLWLQGYLWNSYPVQA